MFKSRTLRYLIRIFSYLPKSRKRELISLFPLAILGGISEIIVIAALARLFNFLIDKPRDPLPFVSDLFSLDPKYKILILISIFILTNWFSSIVKILVRAKQLRLKATIWRDLSELALKNLISQEYEFFIGGNKNDLSASVLVNVNRVADVVVLPVLQTITGSFIISFVSIAVLLIAKATALLLIIGLLLAYLSISLLIIPHIREGNKKRIEVEMESNNILNEALKSIVDVKLTNSEKFFNQKYRNSGRNVIPMIWKGDTLPEIPRTLIEPFGITLIFIIGMGPLIFNSDISKISQAIPFLATIAAASLKLTPPLQDTFKGYNSIRGALPDLEAAMKLIELNQDSSKVTLKEDYDDLKKSKFIYPRENITLKNISYKYPNTDKFALKNINIKIPIGQKIAFIGKTGSGKTTTANQILCLLRPTNGNLLIDNKPLKSSEIQAWQSLCSYVPQSINLLNSDILSNIAYGLNKIEIDEKKVWESIKAAQIEELINSFPEKLKTKVGENGIRLSGGQRQRIAIARAFYRNSKIIVMDEATSALDNKTESNLIKAISNLNKDFTFIFIAHRISTIRECDCIYEFQNGEISAFGKYNELLLKSDSFREIVNKDTNNF